MYAIILEEKGNPPVLGDMPMPEINPDHVLVQLKAAALNHRDVFISQGLYPGIQCPVVLGADGAGWAGERAVIIQPGMGWGENPLAQSREYRILGSPDNGTFAEWISVPSSQAFDKPAHLSFEEAAALPLAGLTAYRVLFTRCQVKAGERILITGIGGGVALFCCQFALAIGMEVWVTSGSDEKIEKAKALGAKGGANYNDEGWEAALEASAGGGFDVIIDSAGGEKFPALVKLSNPGGRIGIYGGTKGTIPKLSPQQIFWKQISIHGSTMGTESDFSAMLAFASKHQIVPVVDSIFDLEDGVSALRRMEEGKQFGKIVLRMP